MALTIRISTVPETFDDYMTRTDVLQLTVVPPPGTTKHELFGWKQEESDQWTLFRTRSNVLYADYSDPDKVSSAGRKKMHLLIDEVRSYDNNKITGHQLLDKVAMNGTVDDCLTFNVKRGTELEANPTQHGPVSLLPIPKMSFKKYEVGLQVVQGENPDIAGSKVLPEGIVFLKVFRCISVTAPTKLSQYSLLGSAKRGEIVSRFDDVVPPAEGHMKAYYYGCYESHDGTMGDASNIISADIMLTAR